MSRGYAQALLDAHGDKSKVHRNYGYYSEDSGTEYDENGDAIPFT